MNRSLGWAVFAAGLLAVLWVALGYVGNSPVALAMTLLIGGFYGLGALELQRYHQATLSLVGALSAVPVPLARLDDWLCTLHASLRNPVRLRVAGERAGLPGPALTPYLVGLLVLLGMLGTFLGMVVTLKGAAGALATSADLPTFRAALTAPVQGLGLAFGTSLAGVAASAMLGLLSALCRRERLHAAQALDGCIATLLRPFSRAQQRETTLQTLQDQARAMPLVVDRLQALVTQLTQQNAALGAQLVQQQQAAQAQLLASQDAFHRQAQVVHGQLAASVGQSLQTSLRDSAHLAASAIQPVVQATMAGMAQQTTALQQQVADALQAQLHGVAACLGVALADGVATWQSALDAQRLGQASLQAELAAAEHRRLAAYDQSLAALARTLQAQWQQAGAESLSQQARICQTLEQTAQRLQDQTQAQARATLAEVAGLMQTAAQAPRAAAELIGQLREQLSGSLARDNSLLEERSLTLATLNTLLENVQHAATGQRSAIDTLVSSSAALLDRIGAQHGERMQAESARLGEVAAQLTGSAVEVASLGEAFGHAVQLFGTSSGALVAQMQGIESALARSSARSDEQLGYYVAQAREIIDLSISSQQQIVLDLQQLAQRQHAQAAEAL